MKKKIAMYQNIIANTVVESVLVCNEDGSCWADEYENYTRLTEPVEVEFAELPKQAVIDKQVAMNNEKITLLEGQIEALKAQNKELLCLEHQAAV